MTYLQEVLPPKGARTCNVEVEKGLKDATRLYDKVKVMKELGGEKYLSDPTSFS